MPGTPWKPHELPPLGAWAIDAACAGTASEVFFPVDKSTPHEAKAICGRCTVRTECLVYALTNRITDGVWGGLTPPERRKVRRHGLSERITWRRAAEQVT